MCSASLFAVDVTFISLLEEMTDVKAVAEFPEPAYKSIQFSSYDRKSVSPNAEDGFHIQKEGRDWGKGWFSNEDFDQDYGDREIGGFKQAVLAEYEGAGVLQRIWMTGGDVFNCEMPISIYIDGEETPSIRMPWKELVGGNGLVGAPFSYCATPTEEVVNYHGRNFYFPIPFSKSILICADQREFEGKNNWFGVYFHIGLRIYEAGTTVQAYRPEFLTTYKEEIAQCANKLGNPFACKKEQAKPSTFTNITINKGESWSSTFTKGALSSINLAFKKGINGIKKERLRNTVIEIAFDGKTTLYMPLDAFFGTTYLGKPHQTLYVANQNANCFKSQWFMPFQNEAKVTLHNLGRRKIVLSSIGVGEDSYDWNENSMYFNGLWYEMRGLETKFKKDLNFLTAEGQGVLVADGVTIFNTHPDWWGEGDEKIFVDNEAFPSHFGTGTEDYYGYAWCRPQAYSAPFCSQASGEGNKAVGTSTNFRCRTLDAIPFNSAITFNMELWHPFYADMNYAPFVFWYQKAGGTSSMKISPEMASQKPALYKWDVK